MKHLLTIIFACTVQGLYSQNVVTTDINNFWNAFDKVQSTKDSTQQYHYINSLFIDKGTPGLKAMMAARRYTATSYVDAINNYPEYWKSIRANTYKAKKFAPEIEEGVNKLKKLYPDFKPAFVYFTIGALRSPGTTMDGMVLIGSELAMGDDKTVTKEFPERFSYLLSYFKSNPINDIVFLNVHEFVHTQQKTTIGNNVLAQCVLEGVAEFVAEKAMNIASTTPAIHFGPKHDKKIKERFTQDMFNPNTQYNWLYNDSNNEFKIRDLGYYTGYVICESYYKKANDKKAAIKEMIEIDYNDPEALAAFVDKSGYFDKPVKEYSDAFEKTRPTVVQISPFKNKSVNLKSGPVEITVEFSSVMDTRYRNFELGPLGASSALRIDSAAFSPDGRSITLEATAEPDKLFQIEIGSQFRSAEGIPLRPYLIEFSTSEK